MSETNTSPVDSGAPTPPVDSGEQRSAEDLAKDLKTAIEKRDAVKAELDQMQAQLGELQAQNNELTQFKQTQTGESEKVIATLREELGSAQETITELSTYKEQNEAQKKKNGFASKVLRDVNPVNMEKARTLLDGFSAQGKVDPLSDDESSAEKATELLKSFDPSLFGVDSRRAPGVPGNFPGAEQANGKSNSQPGLLVHERLQNLRKRT